MSAGRGFRHQLPARSPLTLRSLAGGVASALVSGSRDAGIAALGTAITHRQGVAGALLTDSGTAALRLALQSPPGRALIALPAYGCFDLASAVLGAGASVIFYDIDPLTLSPDARSLERALRHGAGAAVIVHLYGVPVDVPAAMRLAAAHGAIIIDDAAQGAGGAFAGRRLGSFGSLGVLSFGRGKGVTAGRGGALLANDERGLSALRALASLGDTPRGGMREIVSLAIQWALGRPAVYWMPVAVPALRLGETRFRPPESPRPLSAFGAGVLRESLGMADAEADVRRGNAHWLIQRVGSHVQVVTAPAQSVPGFLRLPVLVAPAKARRAHERSARRLGIAPGYPIPLTDLPELGGRVVDAARPMPGARMLADRLITLPVHSGMDESDLDAVARWCAAAY